MTVPRCPSCYGRLRGVHLCPPQPASRLEVTPKRRAGTPERQTLPRPPAAASRAAYSHPFDTSWAERQTAESLARLRCALTATQQAFTLADVAARADDLAAVRFNLGTIVGVCAAALRPAPDHAKMECVNTGKEQAA